MDTKQLVASLVNSLAWPAAIVAIAVLFRTQLKTLLTDRLRHFEAGPLKADFEVQRSAVKATLDRAGITVPSHADADDLTALANQPPQLVIAEAFGRVEQELSSALSSIGKSSNDDTDARELAHLALTADLITPLTINAIEGIIVMRDLAVYGPQREITTTQVDEYLALVEAVLYAIRQNIRQYEARHAHRSAHA